MNSRENQWGERSHCQGQGQNTEALAMLACSPPCCLIPPSPICSQIITLINSPHKLQNSRLFTIRHPPNLTQFRKISKQVESKSKKNCSLTLALRHTPPPLSLSPRTQIHAFRENYRLPVVALLSSEAKIPFPGAEINAAVFFNSSAYGFVFSKLEVITIWPGVVVVVGVLKLLRQALGERQLSTPFPRNALRVAAANSIARPTIGDVASTEELLLRWNCDEEPIQLRRAAAAGVVGGDGGWGCSFCCCEGVWCGGAEVQWRRGHSWRWVFCGLGDVEMNELYEAHGWMMLPAGYSGWFSLLGFHLLLSMHCFCFCCRLPH